jgi:polyhydroxyalkanoate synthase
MQLLPSPHRVVDAAANAYDAVVRGGVADLRRTPARIIDEAPQRTVYRYLPRDGTLPQRALPVLLVPPLAAPTLAFDLRRGCSVAEHMLGLGHPTYLVEYGDIGFSERDLGLEHWVGDVLPAAIRRVSDDAGGRPVQLVGWCLGGIMSLLAVAADADLPVNAVALVASPFDVEHGRLARALRPLADVSDGVLGTAVYRVLGTAPAPLVKYAFRATSIGKELTKPAAILLNLHDRDFLAQVEAVDNFMANMHAYPGRTIGQLYHRFFRGNDLADGRLVLGGREIDLADVDVPVIAIAGEDDVLAPRPAVHHVAALLPNAPEVRLVTAPGGHLGVLTGRGAARTTWSEIDAFLADRAPVEERAHPSLRVVA